MRVMSTASPRKAEPTSNVTAALSFLYTQSLINRARKQFGRLRNPRYVSAIIVAILYLWWMVVRNAGSDRPPFEDMFSNETITVVGSILVLMFSARWWLFKSDRNALAFSPAEVQFLFPAPVTRRALIHNKLFRLQLGILLNTVIFTVLLRGGAGSSAGWQRGFALWILLTTLALHRLATALMRTSAAEHGNAGRRRIVMPAIIFLMLLGAVFSGAVSEWSSISSAHGFKALATAVVGSASLPIPSFALLPARVLIAPVALAGTSSWILAIPGAIAVLVLHYAWVLRLDVAFEEAALDATRERAEIIRRFRSSQQLEGSRSRSGRVARIPRLSSRGIPEVAIVWKNIAAALRGGVLKRQIGLSIALAVFTALGAGSSSVIDPELIVIIPGSLVGVFVLVVPASLRYDLRMDLPRLPVLKTMPLSGRRMVLAEISGSVVLHTAAIWAMMFVPSLVIFSDPTRFGGSSVVSGVVAMALAVPALSALLFTIYNGIALLFPAWVRLGSASRGFETMGQELLTMGAAALIVGVAMVFPIGIGVLVWWLCAGLGPVLAAASGTVCGVLVLLVELWPIVYWLGSVFETIDVEEVVDQASTTGSSA